MPDLVSILPRFNIASSSKAGDDVGQFAVSVLRNLGGVELLEPGADQDRAGIDYQFLAVFSLDLGREVAVESLEFDQLGVEKEADIGMALDPRNPGLQYVLGGVQIGRRQAQPGDVAAEMILLFDQENLLSRIGQFQRRTHSGDAAADDHGGGAHRRGTAFQGFLELDPLNRRMDQGLGLFGGGHRILVDPAALLANVGHLQHVRVQPRPLDGAAEGALVHARAAGSDDQAGQPVLMDVLGNHLLSRVGAHVLIPTGLDHARDSQCKFSNRRHIHHLCDVGAAAANVNANPLFCHG